MLIGGVLAMGYQMAHHQETEDEQIVEQASIMSTPDSVKSEMALQLEREALLERVRAMYTLVSMSVSIWEDPWITICLTSHSALSRGTSC